MKLMSSCSEVYNRNTGPHENYLWGQKRKNNLKSKLLKNMGNIIDVLEREVATQNQKLCNIQEEIITKRESKGNIASAREVVMGKLHHQTSAITLTNMSLEIWVMVLQKTIEIKETECLFQVEVTRAKEKTTQAIIIQYEYTTELKTKLLYPRKTGGHFPAE